MSDRNIPTKTPRPWVFYARFLLAAVMLFGTIVYVVTPWVLIKLNERPFLGRVQSELRSTEVALRSYKIDHAVYPAGNELSPQLTTPLNYLNYLVNDPFAPAAQDTPAAWLRYASDGSYYLIWSVGPDQVSQISGIADLDAGLEALVPLTYDPSNGVSSKGDIWRSNLGRENEEPIPAKDLPNIPCP